MMFLLLTSLWLTLILGLATTNEFALHGADPLSPGFIVNRKLDGRQITTEDVQVNIGFLVGSRRLKHDKSYPRPGQHLIKVFKYGMYKINELYGDQRHSNDQVRSGDHNSKPRPVKRLLFLPTIAETFGNESESIKQTIDLITRQKVNFIVGPQETCQVESRLASIFNIGMMSHYCSQWAGALAEQLLHVEQRPALQDGQTLDSTAASMALNLAKQHWHLQLPASLGATTFIQTKPPHWKIAERVVTLVDQLLETNDSYPHQLVLLYFRRRLSAQTQSAANYNDSFDNKAAGSSSSPFNLSASETSSSSSNFLLQAPHLGAQVGNDAIQYELIGELLEIKLNELLARVWRKRQRQLGATRQPLVAVLNWHTTFHYGIPLVENPFRQIIRRHLFQQQQRPANQAQCSGGDATATKGPLMRAASSGGAGHTPVAGRAAIYIVVGHYYEHLGLMLALNELKLLDNDNGHQQQQPQPSVMMPNQRRQHRPQSVVIGVDTEQYDGREDSVHFLSGLLMNEPGSSSGSSGGQERAAGSGGATSSSSSSDLHSSLYRHYLGVVPARPTRMAEFLEDMRAYYSGQVNFRDDHHLGAYSRPNLAPNQGANQTLDSMPLNLGQILALIRLPVEAFYLYDSIMLIGSYFNECLIGENLTLGECSEGRRAYEWFRNRKYSSSVDADPIRFDSNAQTDGSYTVIARKPSNESSMSSASESAEDEFSLMPVGRFITGSSGSPGSTPNTTADHYSTTTRLKIYVNYNGLDQIWLPLWCLVQKSNITECVRLTNQSLHDWQQTFDTNPEGSEASRFFTFATMAAILLAAFLILFFVLQNDEGAVAYCCGNSLLFTGSKHGKVVSNAGWFNERDEENFLKIVSQLLVTPEIGAHHTAAAAAGYESQFNEGADLAAAAAAAQMEGARRDERLEASTLIELHCHMFPFPSCKFVHWLTALHQLKEMMFQYHQSNSIKKSRQNSSSKWRRLEWFKGIFEQAVDQSARVNSSRGFFTTKHKATGSLRLLLNKYKSINECLCTLSELKSQSVVKLLGTTLSYNVGGSENKMVRLIVEQPDRGNLRDSLSSLDETLGSRRASEFRSIVVGALIEDLLEGLKYLHESKIEFHGELRATTCLLTTNWRLKLSGFHVLHLRRSLGEYEQKYYNQCPYSSKSRCYFSGKELSRKEEGAGEHWDELIYSAPEILENYNRRATLSGDSLRSADFYSLGFVIYELLVGQEPWSCLTPQVRKVGSKVLIDRVKVDSSFRPPLSRLDKPTDFSAEFGPEGGGGEDEAGAGDGGGGRREEGKCLPPVLSSCSLAAYDSDVIQRVIRSCWSHSPERRPQSVALLRSRLESLSPSGASISTDKANKLKFASKSGFIMKYYAESLEKISIHRRRQLAKERQRSLDLKLKLLPESIVYKMYKKNSGHCVTRAQQFECVSLCSFTLIPVSVSSEQLGPNVELNFLEYLNDFLIQLDRLVETYHQHIYLIDSQVDSSLRYMIYSGEPLASSEGLKKPVLHCHSQLVASFALQLIDLANKGNSKSKNFSIQVRCGLHSGPVLGGLLPMQTSTSSSAGHNLIFTNHINSDSWCAHEDLEGDHVVEKVKAGARLARYVLLGQTIQLCHSLESTSLPQRIQISQDFYAKLLKQGTMRLPGETDIERLNGSGRQGYVMIKREGRIQAKGLCELDSYWLLNGPRLSVSQSIMLSTSRANRSPRE